VSCPEKRGKHLTGRWYGEFRRLFETKDLADLYESCVRAIGEEPDWARKEKRAAEKSAAEQRVSQLEEELYSARRVTVELMPDELAKLLKSYHSCTSPEELLQWKIEVVERIVSLAEIEPEASYFEKRGYCPLCKRGSIGSLPGYKIPGGLEDHLWGGSHARRCPVTEAAFENAEFRLRNTFEASAEAAKRKMDERRRTERVFLTDPSSPPKLLDEALDFFDKTRSSEELAAAEERLRSINFEVEVTDNVVAYKFRHEHYLVLADPRKAGRIEFGVFDSETSKGRAGPETFYLLDGWKNNLAAKFSWRLSEAYSRLAPHPARAEATRKRHPSTP
jgi:hypothetical protein